MRLQEKISTAFVSSKVVLDYLNEAARLLVYKRNVTIYESYELMKLASSFF